MLRRIGLGVAAQVFSLLISMMDRLVLVGVMIRIWGADIYADWVLLSAAAAMIAMAEAGLNIYFGNAWQAAFARADRAGFARVLSIGIAIYGLLLLVLSSATIAYVVVVDPASKLHLRMVDHASATLVMVILGGAVILRVCRGLVAQIYRGIGLFARGIFADSLVSLTTVILALSALALQAGIVTVAALYLASEICIGWCGMIADLRRRHADLRFRPAVPSRAELNALLRQLPWFAMVQGVPNLWLNLPVLLLSTIVGAGVGVVEFVLLRTLVNFARQLVSMTSLAAGVELAALNHATSDRSLVQRRLQSVGLLCCTISAAACSGLYIFLEPLIHIWTGSISLADPQVLACLAAGMLASAPTVPLLAMTTYGSNPRAPAMVSLSQVACGLPLAAAGAHTFGLVGFAAGLAAGEITAQLLFAPRLLAPNLPHFPWVAYLSRCALRILMCVAWCLAVGHLLGGLFDVQTLVGLLLAAFAWGVAGGIPGILIGLDADLRSAIRTTLLRGRAAA